MKIKFEITDIPQAEQLKYPTAYLEGVLTIMINDVYSSTNQEYYLLSLQLLSIGG